MFAKVITKTVYFLTHGVHETQHLLATSYHYSVEFITIYLKKKQKPSSMPIHVHVYSCVPVHLYRQLLQNIKQVNTVRSLHCTSTTYMHFIYTLIYTAYLASASGFD